MKIVYYDAVDSFLSTLEKSTKGKVFKSLDLLELYGGLLSMPHVKPLAKGLYELRVSGRQEIRVFFCHHNGEIVLLHGFTKKTQKTPRRELNLAKKRKLLLTKK